jgi:hypothetical protein
VRTSSYHPQGNGRTERSHRSLKYALQIYASHSKFDWDSYLPAISFALNYSVRGQFSPFYLLMGREPSIPLVDDMFEGVQLPDVIQLKRARDTAEHVSKLQLLIQKAYFDRKAETRTFKEGDMVLFL